MFTVHYVMQLLGIAIIFLHLYPLQQVMCNIYPKHA